MNKTTSNYEKHTTEHPLQRMLIERFYDTLISLIADSDCVSVLDAGCGEGFTLNRLKQAKVGKKHEGFDASKEAVRIGKKTFPELHLTVGDIYAIPHKNTSFDVVICSEVLEHLTAPQRALEELRRVSKRYVILSVPWEPWFQLANFIRGKYISGWGNHPEHINHWTHKGFISCVRQAGFTVITSRISFPWTIVLAAPSDTI